NPPASREAELSRLALDTGAVACIAVCVGGRAAAVRWLSITRFAAPPARSGRDSEAALGWFPGLLTAPDPRIARCSSACRMGTTPSFQSSWPGDLPSFPLPEGDGVATTLNRPGFSGDLRV